MTLFKREVRENIHELFIEIDDECSVAIHEVSA